MRKMIYMNDPLIKLAEETKGNSARTSGFSRRLGEIVERYDIILSLTTLPEFSEAEIKILSECICGSTINSRKIRGLHLDILDAETGSREEKQSLSSKIEKLSPADRMIIVEKLGQ